MNIRFSEVRRNHFEEISNRIEADRDMKSEVTVYYNGHNLNGVLEMECTTSTTFKKMLLIATEVITKKKEA